MKKYPSERLWKIRLARSTKRIMAACEKVRTSTNLHEFVDANFQQIKEGQVNPLLRIENNHAVLMVPTNMGASMCMVNLARDAAGNCKG